METEFERQFKNCEYIPFLGTSLQILDLDPGDLSGQPPILLAPGWSATTTVNKLILRTIFESGRRVLSLNHTRQGVYPPDDSGFPWAERQKASALIHLIRSKKLNEVDVIAHSEGAINVSIATILRLHSFRVRRMVLISSCGLLEHDNLLALAWRFFKEARKELSVPHVIQPAKKDDAKVDGGNILDYVFANPRLSLAEIKAMVSFRFGRRVQLDGLPEWLCLIHHVDDCLFPIERVIKSLPKDVLHGFYSVKGHHNQVLGDPRVTQLALFALKDPYIRSKL